MKTKIVSQLPIPSSGCGDTRFCFDKGDALLEFEFRKTGGDWIGGILFDGVTAFRFRDEMRSLGYAEGSYDALVEILDSDWVNELKKLSPPRKMGIDGFHHFATFL